MLDPREIEKKQFGTTRIKEGYDQIEVDSFLDLIVVDYRVALERAARAEQDVVILRRKLEAASEAPTTVIPTPPSASAERILVAAQKTADQVEADANAEAGRIRAAARAEAENLKMVAEAERQTILNRLASERADLERQIEELNLKRSNFTAWLRATLDKMEEANDA